MQGATSQPSSGTTSTAEGPNNVSEADTASTVLVVDTRGLSDQEVEQEVNDNADADYQADIDAEVVVPAPGWIPGSERPPLLLDSDSEPDTDKDGHNWRTSTRMDLRRQTLAWTGGEPDQEAESVVDEAESDVDEGRGTSWKKELGEINRMKTEGGEGWAGRSL